MTAQRQPTPLPVAPILLCGRCKHTMECPVCDADTPAAQPELPPERLLLSLSEAAEAMGVDADTVTKWGREAGLPLFRRGRVVRVYVPQLREWIGRQMERRR